MVDLGTPRRIHIIGVGGAGMSALAKLLTQMGHRVTGSDLRRSTAFGDLAALGVGAWEGSDPAALGDVEVVVASSAVPDRDAEWRTAGELGIERWRRPDLLAALTSIMPALGVTGTHGKTSSTAMLVAALRSAGRDPSFVVGGVLGGLGTNAHLGESSLFVVEADEAFGTFLSLDLTGLVVTNVEAEHLEYYDSLAAIEDAFATVARGVSGPVFACIDDPGARRLAARVGTGTYGIGDGDWRAESVELDRDEVRFVLHHGGDHTPVRVPMPGRHTVLNATGVLALAGATGHDVEAAAAGLAAFRGVKRRFERRGTVRGVSLIDDYAHHPTEVRATVQAARAGGWSRIWAVFQPHLYSRTQRLHREFGAALAGVDHVVVTDVYGARETPVPGVTGRLVADAAEAATDATVHYVAHRSDIAEYLAARVEPGDLVLSMGAGDITLLADELGPLLVEP